MSDKILYQLVSNNGRYTLSVLVDGKVETMDSSHPKYSVLRDHLFNMSTPDRQFVKECFGLALEAGTHLELLSERVSLHGNTIYFDGDPIRGPLAEHIVNLIREGDTGGWKPFVNFLEKLAQNPSEASKESLFNWLLDRQLTIRPNGDFVAYKGVIPNDKGTLVSVSSGRAIVDGKAVSGRIPNKSGSVITMPRSEVNDNVDIGCSHGLHAGTWDYASSFVAGTPGSKVLLVYINPRDVVSVPSDSLYQKLRVSRYEAGEAVSNPLETLTYDDSYTEFDYDDLGYDADGYDEEGYDADGYDEEGYDAEGYDGDGLDENGYDRFGRRIRRRN